MRPLLLLSILVVACAPAGRPAGTPAPDADQAVVLVSLDGFHPDYLKRGVTPHLAALARRGVRAEWMTPSFPTKTFPNHYTLVTGLLPDHHGIVSNNMLDDSLGTFRMSIRKAVQDARWWGGEPIWVTAEQQGVTAGAMFWPGSEAPIKGTYATHWVPFDEAFPDTARVDSVLAWLDPPTGPSARFTTLYYSDVDGAGHRHGPNAGVELDDALRNVDAMIGRLVAGIAERGMSDRVNIIVVTDHGMSEISKDRLVRLDDYIDLDDVTVIDWTPFALVQPKPGKLESVHAALKGKHQHLKVYHRDEVPPHLHYGTHPRVPDLVLIADDGWSITSSLGAENWAPIGGTHGYDPTLASMRALFLAAGPAFREGVVVPPFRNIHVYELMAKILGLVPAPNDGSLDSVRTMLRSSEVATSLQPERIAAHLQTLASDAFEGRRPGTRGDTLAHSYVRDALEQAGLTPAGSDGGWFQQVPLVTLGATGELARRLDDHEHTFAAGNEVAFQAGGPAVQLVNAAAVFVGYGIDAGTGQWDDYKGVDVRGKVVVMLQGTPGTDEWRGSGARLPAGGKLRAAMDRGAAAVVTVAPGASVASAAANARRGVIRIDSPVSRTASVPSLLLHEEALARFAGTGDDLAALRSRAGRASFRPEVLPGQVDLVQRLVRAPFHSPNVLGIIPGSDPVLRDETVVVTAHWDHLGRDTMLTGDQIFNGALDNASGTATMLEIARAMAAGAPPRRSVLFIATTAEEAGLLGARWYASNPLRPLASTVAAINIDFVAPWGKGLETTVIGMGYTSLDSVLAEAAQARGRRIIPDPMPEQQFYRRSDHFAFVELGIPGFFSGPGNAYLGEAADYGRTRFDSYLLSDYHRQSDEVREDFRYVGMADDAAILFDLVLRVANGASRPTWIDRPETAAYREAAARLSRP
ncbi:MAG: alkaline phosphatase family protein [Gemmatimonadales bacterium]|nr:alkaline phosphatase family protein [Gemmatimonadales bacterium]